MSQDGRPQTIPIKISGPARLNWRIGSCGNDFVAGRSGFGRCAKGHMHCGRCGKIARRFRKGYVCGC